MYVYKLIIVIVLVIMIMTIILILLGFVTGFQMGSGQTGFLQRCHKLPSLCHNYVIIMVCCGTSAKKSFGQKKHLEAPNFGRRGSASCFHDTGVCEKHVSFRRALALQLNRRHCSPAPDLVLRKPSIPACIIFRRSVFFHRHQDGPVPNNAWS